MATSSASVPTTPVHSSTATTPHPSPSERADRVLQPAQPANRKRMRDELHVGQHLFEHKYYVVNEIIDEEADTGFFVRVTDQKGHESCLPLEIVEGLTSTSHYTAEYEKLPTELSRMPETFNQEPFRVTYSKQVEANDVADALLTRIAEAGEGKAKCRKIMRELMKGGRRVMNAKLRLTMHGEPIMERGRYSVIDLDVAAKRGGDPGVRWVDSRTITELVVNGMRFYSKEHKD